MQQFFGIMLSALYEINEIQDISKHSLIYEALKKFEEEQKQAVLHKSLYLSLVFQGVSPVSEDFEEEILNLNLQVVAFK